MKKVHVVLSAIVGAVLGLALHRTLMSYWSMTSWLSPVFMFVSAIIGIVVYDPIGCWGVVKRSFKQTVEKVPSWENFKKRLKGFGYDFVSVQILALSFSFWIASWTSIVIAGLIYGFQPNVPEKLVLIFNVPVGIFAIFWSIITILFNFFALITDSKGVNIIKFRSDCNDTSRIFFKISGPVTIFYRLPKAIIGIDYLGILNFLVIFVIQLVANTIIFVGSCRETLVVAFGSAIGYLAGFISGSFLTCAVVGGLVALMMMLLSKIKPIYNWAVWAEQNCR